VSVGGGGGEVSASEVVGSVSVELVAPVSSVVTASVSVDETVVVSSVPVLTLLASTGVPSSAWAAKAPPSAAPRANTTVAAKRRPTDRARIDPCSR